MIDKDALTAIATTNPCAHDLFQLWSQRLRNQKETRVGRSLEQLIDVGSNHTRTDVVAVFQTLENYGCGKFVIGRRGRKSRFVWDEPMIHVSHVALDIADEVTSTTAEEIAMEDIDDEPDWLVHSFNLRDDLEIEIELPADLTSREAERLASLMEALAF